MTSVLLSPRIEAESTAPTKPMRRGRLVAYGAVAVAVFLAGLIQDGVARQGAFVAFSLTLGALVFAMLAAASEVHGGAIRVRSGGVLCFVPRARLAGTYWLYVCLGLIPGALMALDMRITRKSSVGIPDITAFAMGIVSVYMLIRLTKLIRQLRLPVGLAVSERGLSGVRNGGRVAISWDELQGASAMTIPSGPLVVFSVASGPTVLLRGVYIGSDPNLVAAIVEHFRTHPEDRVLLADGAAAIRAVENAPPAPAE
ncbi:hypothetical protein [Demequina lutea]|uniref:PH domain-containing protein n=1 Tax=Demequina lutea TaxID=431489 RepID=A0A7Y9Z707_9MICO|nr:hypothetical protein [Demequina lutea]NYI39969.1 hypothetical protein [Demequina lutea]